MRSSTACTSGTTSLPSTTIFASRRRAQRDVQHRAILGRVDLVAAKHRVDALAQAAGVGQRRSSRRSVSSRDAVLRIVEIEAGGFGGEALAALGIVGEQLAQMRAAHLVGMCCCSACHCGSVGQRRRGATRHDVSVIRARRWRVRVLLSAMRCSSSLPRLDERLRRPRAAAARRAHRRRCRPARIARASLRRRRRPRPSRR